MKKTAVIFCFLILSAGFVFGETSMSQTEKGSYVLGYSIGENLRNNGIEVNHDLFVKGLSEAMNGKKSPFSKAESKALMMNLQRSLKDARLKNNLKRGEKFLQENSLKDGVVQIGSGLQYKVLKAGKGKRPRRTDRVSVHYTGSLISGKVFDSSYRRGKPTTFKVNGVIKGWQEALQLMSEGSKWKLFIPAKLAYGERGAGPIGPGETLIFDVELIKIE